MIDVAAIGSDAQRIAGALESKNRYDQSTIGQQDAHEAALAARQAAGWAGAMFWAAVAETLVTAAGVYLVYRTLREAKRSADAAVDATKAAAGTLTHAERTSKQELRAYLYVMSNRTPNFEADGPLEGWFLLKNAGQTPALKVRTLNAMSIGRLPFETEPPELPEAMFEGGGLLAPGATMRLRCKIDQPPPPKWREALLNKTHAVCMYGEIRYEDVFGDEHRTTYKSMYSGPITADFDEIIWCKTGNDAT